MDNIRELIEVMAEAELTRIKWQKGDELIELEKSGAPAPAVVHHAPPPPPPAGEQPKVIDGQMVTSPMVGTFYISPSPDSDPFVKLGDSVSEDSVVCIIEAMKVMNEVKAGVSGTVKEVLVENGQPVEFGTPLYRLSHA